MPLLARMEFWNYFSSSFPLPLLAGACSPAIVCHDGDFGQLGLWLSLPLRAFGGGLWLELCVW